MTDELDSLPDDKLRDAFAREYLGRAVEDGMMRGRDEVSGGHIFESWVAIPPFSTSANAVLPLVKTLTEDVSILWAASIEQWRVEIKGITCFADTLPQALCIALIRAKRAQQP